MTEHMKVADLMRGVQDGDGLTWLGEFDWLRVNHAARLRGLFLSVLQNGIREPLLIGDDGRLWDGHHRLYVAYTLGFTHVPVKHARRP